MSTDGPTPAPCNPKLYKYGVCVGMFETFGANHFDAIIRTIAVDAGCKVDWHYAGGRARVLCMEADADIVRPVIETRLPPILAKKRIELWNQYEKECQRKKIQ